MAQVSFPHSMMTIWDTSGDGPAEMQVSGVTAREFMARDSRYTDIRPATVSPTKAGLNRIIIDSGVQ